LVGFFFARVMRQVTQCDRPFKSWNSSGSPRPHSARQERFLRNVHAADALHPLLAFLLLFEQFFFRVMSPP